VWKLSGEEMRVVWSYVPLVTDAAPRTFLHKWRRAVARCTLYQRQLCADSVLCKVARTDQTGPMETSSDHLGCCSAARHCGHSCILQHFCWLKRRCADKPDQCSCSDCSRSIPSQLRRSLFDDGANFTKADVRKSTLEQISN
jgi:hypothetical protein